MKLLLGCGPSPIHQQHKDVMGDFKEWTFVDLHVEEAHIKNWDATKLKEVKNSSVEEIYSSHLLEHFPHTDTESILKRWYDVLIPGGKLILNVPDLVWAARELVRLDNGQVLHGYYDQFEGEHGLLSIFYGSQSHDGEFHKTGFTASSIINLLVRVGFKDIEVDQVHEAHDMRCLIVEAIK